VGNRFKVGDLEVLAVSDGLGFAPGTIYFRGTTDEQWEKHKRWLNHAGQVEFPFSCFLIDSVKPEDVDVVFLTHLHIDHCGNVAHDDGEAMKAVFPNATYRWTAQEDEFWQEPDPRAASAGFDWQKMMAAVSGRFEIADDGAVIAPGINVIGTPGHTPGHAGVILSSQGKRAFILGDAISCPVQLEETEWCGMGDMDGALARRSQEAALQEIETDGALMTACHFPGLTLGRVLQGEGKRYWEAV